MAELAFIVVLNRFGLPYLDKIFVLAVINQLHNLIITDILFALWMQTLEISPQIEPDFVLYVLTYAECANIVVDICIDTTECNYAFIVLSANSAFVCKLLTTARKLL